MNSKTLINPHYFSWKIQDISSYTVRETLRFKSYAETALWQTCLREDQSMLYSQPISSNNQPASKWITMDWLSPSLTLYYTQENPPQLRDQHCSRGLCCLPPFCRSISKISISPIFQATEVAPRAQPSPCTCVQMIWTKGKFGLSTAIARDKLPGKQNHRLKKKQNHR